MSQINVDPGGYRSEDTGSRWLLPLLLGLLALAVIAWLLFANPFNAGYSTTGAGTNPPVATVAPGSTGGTTGTTGGTSATTPGGTTSGSTGSTGTTGGSYGAPAKP
jgi:hypothetical protein